MLQCAPDEVLAQAGLEPEKIPSADEIERKLLSLREDRERLGGVNLRADEEAVDVAKQLESLIKERDDLIQAINKLRGAISSLNREGRQRLLDAFGTVNQKFGELFTTLFGGGKAELQLIESDDPLEAGLEIIANPPGKKPTVLSLLSGGEQTLTALSLIFAVFLTNPSPICVLDEVDAPLDDHNVERFCNLLEAMLERTETRFLIITHHALTMARMHRLFGVTMLERGVSQLVSVNLQEAETLAVAV
jgi:chromosome segregation protein